MSSAEFSVRECGDLVLLSLVPVNISREFLNDLIFICYSSCVLSNDLCMVLFCSTIIDFDIECALLLMAL